MGRRGPASFSYAPELKKTLQAANLDIIHTHGLWMYPSVAATRWSNDSGRPFVISPRGMLDPWAIRNSRWKKRVAGLLYEHAHLRNAACLHALCHSEYEAIRGYGLTNPVAIIPNGVNLPKCSSTRLAAPDWRSDLPPNGKILLYLGRIHPKKGLVNLLHAWKDIQGKNYTAQKQWHLVIAGWDQHSHEKQLKKLATDLNINKYIHFVGPLFDERKTTAMANADAFILPSYSEGLPMAVLEAWSHALPVIMTPQCNLPEGFSAGAAVKTHPDPSSISQSLVELFITHEDDLQIMGSRGFKLVKEKFMWPGVASQMLEVYDWVLGHTTRPSCVKLD
ncbi:poly(glycerol-phosphate) alpha-glucosyltransferase [Desulfomarina profundi]|uniref:Poly(Glycerol-phosphate) alpha-glucosyltransferase n=2 Tax=Desulfomarina profundi TaxID=2772557 RepID=A0A8D5FFN1_9BACT|nr:poly(glycerol-phosphate) alpha-glucosyltransferase [Desulfomarina profundi]